MAYTAPNTFTAGNTIQASELEENARALQAYVSGQIVSGDIATGWAEDRHVLRGEYLSSLERWDFASGVAAGRYLGKTRDELTYVTQFNTSKLSSTDANWSEVPEVGVPFDLPDTSLVLFRYEGTLIVHDDGQPTTTLAEVEIVIDGTPHPTARTEGIEESGAVALPVEGRHQVSGYWQGTLTAGSHYVTLRGRAGPWKATFTRLSLLLDAWRL